MIPVQLIYILLWVWLRYGPFTIPTFPRQPEILAVAGVVAALPGLGVLFITCLAVSFLLRDR